MAKRLVIIDGKSVFYRGYYAMPNLSTADGTPTGGVYGFTALSLEVIKMLKPDYVTVAWDKPKTNIRKRLEIYPEYKAGRKPAPADFYTQIPILHQLLQAFGWPLYELDDYEADDIMATLARKASSRGIEVCLITSDLDALQAIDPLVSVYILKKGLTNIDLFKPESFQERYGLKVEQFLDLKSLKGDSSDNIPGVPGIGEKTATDLLQKFDNLDNIYNNLWQIKDSLRLKLESGKESAYLSKKLAELWFDAPVPLDLEAMDCRDLDTVKLKELLQKLEFRSLLRNLPDFMGDQNSNEPSLIAQELTNSKAKTTLLMAEELIVFSDNEYMYLSHEYGKMVKLSINDTKDILSEVPIIGHNTKELLKQLLSAGINKLPDVKHDTAQGSFLLNSLRKSRELADLIGVESIESPGHAINAIWTLYNEQSQALDSLPKLSNVAKKMDFPLINILANMEYLGIKLDVNKLVKMESELAKDISSLENSLHNIAGTNFNVASPSQLADVLFNKLKLPTTNIKKGKTGFSTGQKELDKLRGQHSIIELIEKFRELTKLQNTYVQTLPTQIDENNRIHTTFNQDVAGTGRLSSTDPNLQNIPIRTDIGRKIRDAFIPNKGNVFVNADYSQFELRLVAVLAGDKKMINDFNAGTDIHAKTASEIYGLPIDEVTVEQRRRAKVVNFGVLYGMSQHGLAAAANMSFSEAQHFIDEYFRVRPAVKKYMEDTIKSAHTDGFVETLFGRRRWTPDVKSVNFAIRAGAERAAFNMPIQGTEADLMKLAMIEVDKKLDKDCYQLLQIHDSILIECPKNKASDIGEMLVDVMENIYPKLGVKLQVDIKIGNNWGEV